MIEHGQEREHEQLLHFLYAAPIGLVQTSLDGEIELINSVSAKLLLPIARDPALQNLFAALAAVFPDLRREVSLAKPLNCVVCEGLRYEIPTEGGSLSVSLSLTKVDGRRLIAVLTDVTELVARERAHRTAREHYEQELLRSREQLEGLVVERTAELQRSQLELEQRAQQAEAASNAKGVFLANMSHEIRTPLNAILGNLELLRRKDPRPNQLELIDDMESSAKYLLGTLSDVLELSKIEAGDLPIHAVDFMLDDVLAQVNAVACDAAARKQLTLKIDAVRVPQRLRGDPARLAQILVNYVINAIKFTAQGEVRLAVSQVSDDAAGCELLFEVHDTGTGISPDTSAQLFLCV